MPTANRPRSRSARATRQPSLGAALRSLSNASLESRLRDGLAMMASELIDGAGTSARAANITIRKDQLLDQLARSFERAFIMPPAPRRRDSADARGILISLLGIGGMLADTRNPRDTTRPLAQSLQPEPSDTVSTAEAARLLNVSRPYVVKLADAGKLGPITKTEGRHRRLLASAVQQYVQTRQRDSVAAMARLVDVSQAAGAYDDEGASRHGRKQRG
ncbi:MAG: excisionase family DNA-binding protein [Burkholderia gladioli]